ncbi:high affinity sulfate transporter 1 [Stackebrandtia albiflava]|uniref:High affinity sulfate transporter 1 n=1 Tax=Stackebrandtia albiflava TaxID=406432 RepID=A0A562V4J1_9ACTN|nr:SulP family inorganic anion transporter [Stackebrandtia albiflava]TWJ12811.1 high affinity sulfate transporter 1 [Stackebrandtia albiflava]
MPNPLRHYRSAWLRPDLVAGLTVWAVLVPESLAYAAIAGVPPVVGLYAAVPALVLYAFFGSSRHLVVGPMAATAALSASIVAVYADGRDYAVVTVALALVTGVVALAAGLLRLGFLAAFISEPVLKGFILGMALTIIVGQVPKLLGVEKAEGNFFAQVWEVLTRLGDTHLWTLGIGVSCLAVVLGFRRWLPLVPGSLVAVAVGIVAVAALGLDEQGVAVVGHIDAGLPAPGLPDVPVATLVDLIGPAVGVMLIGFAEGLGAAKTYADRNGYRIVPDRELIGLGAANLGAGLTSGMVVNGSLSKTAVNGGAGARTQLSGLTVAVLTVVTLLFLTGLFARLPEAALAAIVIAALIELVDFRLFARYWRASLAPRGTPASLAARPDFTAAVAAMLGVLIFDTLPGLVIGMALSLLLLVYRSSRPRLTPLGRTDDGRWVDRTRHEGAEPVEGVAVVRCDGSLYFANADYVRAALLTAAAGRRALVLDGESMPAVDLSGAEMLTDLDRRLAGDGVDFYLAHDIGQVRDILRRTDSDLERVYPTVEAAVRAAEESR